MGFCSTSLCHSPRRDVSIHLFIFSYSLIYRFVPEIPQKAVSRLIPLPHPRFAEDPALLFRLPNKWPVRSDRPFCRSLGNGQAATLLQSNILLKTRRYRDKISTCYCRAVPMPFQRLYKVFLRYWGIAKQDARKSLRHHFRGRSTRLRAAMCDK